MRRAADRVRLVDVRAALWTARALRDVRRELRDGVVRGVVVRRPPRLPAAAVRGVHALLRRRPHTCLERALVLQEWYAGHDDFRDVVIAGRGASSAFEAHAWVDGDPDDIAEHFREMLRLPARVP